MILCCTGQIGRLTFAGVTRRLRGGFHSGTLGGASLSVAFGNTVNPEEYSSALEAAAGEMRENGIKAECRGSGLARFVRAERGVRAVEISGLMPGASLGVFENGRDLSRPDFFETIEAATAEAIAWLTEKG